ncbi:MAG: anti-virulence regulator CigR family protein [Kiloniellales bacterium]
MSNIQTRRRLLIGLAALSVPLVAGTALADNGKANNKDKGKGKSGNGNSGSGTTIQLDDSGLSVRFSNSEIRIINDYYRRYPATNVKGLPPGIAKNLARGKPLPPGIAKRYLPNNLTALLPSPYAGTNRLIVGNDILLVQVTTGLILDVLSNVLN